MTKGFGLAGVVLGALSITTPGASAATTGLAGAQRTAFVDASVASCTAAAEQKNPDVSHQTIVGYCVCYSNRMADTIAPSELPMLDSMANDPARLERFLQPRIQAAIQLCRPKSK